MSEYSTTPNLGLFKPNYNKDWDSWGDHLNLNADKLDQAFGGSTSGPFLPLSGVAPMTGPLTLAGDAMAPLHAVPLQQLDAAFAEGPFLALSGGTMSGPLLYTATGGTTVRSAQDRAADIVNVLDLGAKGDTLGFIDGTMAVGSNILASTLATFTAADVGKVILATGAGAGNTALKGTITGFTDAHHVTLSFSAATAIPWNAGGVGIGGNFYYGTDDTAAVAAAIASARSRRGEAYFPSGCYWLASQTSAISLTEVALRGQGTGDAFWPYIGGSLVLLSNPTTAAFNGVAGTSVVDMGFYYPGIDAALPTPASFPPLFEADTASNAHVNTWFTRVRVINATTVFHATIAGSWARTFVTDCLLYGTRSIFHMESGFADVVQVSNTYFGSGAMDASAGSGNAYLAKYTRANGAVFRLDMAAGNYALAEGVIWTGGIVQNYRYSFLVTSGSLTLSHVSNVNWDGLGTLLSVQAAGTVVTTIFSGGQGGNYNKYDQSVTESFVECLSTQPAGSDLTMTGMRIGSSMGHVVNDVTGKLGQFAFTDNTVSGVGRSTTVGTYYVYTCGAAPAGVITLSDNNMLNNAAGAGNTIVGFNTLMQSGACSITGNTFFGFTTAVVLNGAGGSYTVSGNTSAFGTNSLRDISTANTVHGPNNWNTAPVLQTGGNSRGISTQPGQNNYLVGGSGSHVFNVGTNSVFTLSSTGIDYTLPAAGSTFIINSDGLFTNAGDTTMTFTASNTASAILGFNITGIVAMMLGLDNTGVFQIGGWSWGQKRLSLTSAGNLAISGALGVNGSAPLAKPTITGSKGANAALASLLTALASYGLVTDSST